ncbi:hypothetical protein GGX14DRAFT_569802 [Mycena pura]|uniref:Uncharacterized protein n=1 Tax=Mycena pura TaxID=153505 RepID=A0AAD6YBC5_9AGAR|nr:hypothetical protein GGX14DRAFT_569802 [Mycena pura]
MDADGKDGAPTELHDAAPRAGGREWVSGTPAPRALLEADADTDTGMQIDQKGHARQASYAANGAGSNHCVPRCPHTTDVHTSPHDRHSHGHLHNCLRCRLHVPLRRPCRRVSLSCTAILEGTSLPSPLSIRSAALPTLLSAYDPCPNPNDHLHGPPAPKNDAAKTILEVGAIREAFGLDRLGPAAETSGSSLGQKGVWCRPGIACWGAGALGLRVPKIL